MLNFITQRYSKQGLWTLFLMCAFPLHLWTLILAFRDFSWVTERTNAWDAIGVVSYGLLFAFVESVVIFLIVALIGLVLPKSWDAERRISLLAFLILITGVWAMVSQLLFLWDVSLPAQAVEFLRNSDHPVRITYAVLLVVITLTVLLPAYSLLRTNKAVIIMQNFMERLSLLTMFYLFFDLVGVIIILVRNL
jgi:hypothetical protein